MQDFSHQQYHSTDQTTLRQPIIAQRYGNSVTLGCILEQKNTLLKTDMSPQKMGLSEAFSLPFFKGSTKKNTKTLKNSHGTPKQMGSCFESLEKFPLQGWKISGFFGDGASKFSGKERYLFTWYPKQPFFIGCLSWMMIPNLYIKKCLVHQTLY